MSALLDFAAACHADRCESMHSAIRGNRTNLPSFGTMPSKYPDIMLELRACPHCDTTVSTRVPKKELKCAS